MYHRILRQHVITQSLKSSIFYEPREQEETMLDSNFPRVFTPIQAHLHPTSYMYILHPLSRKEEPQSTCVTVLRTQYSVLRTQVQLEAGPEPAV